MPASVEVSRTSSPISKRSACGSEADISDIPSSPYFTFSPCLPDGTQSLIGVPRVPNGLEPLPLATTDLHPDSGQVNLIHRPDQGKQPHCNLAGGIECTLLGVKRK